jgi:methylated-DNA-protein-cysteine methyltransferase-like protein
VYKKLKCFVGDPTVSYVYRYSKTVNDEVAFICYAQPAHLGRMVRFDAALLDPQAPWCDYFTRWVEPAANNQVDQVKQVKATPASQSKESPEPVPLKTKNNASPQEKLRALLTQIPKGKVTTYGWLATQIYGNPGAAQGIVSMLKTMSYTSAPCHRVVSNDGQPKALDVNYGNTGKTHKQLLQGEGVIFLGHATIDMSKCFVKPRLT